MTERREPDANENPYRRTMPTEPTKSVDVALLPCPFCGGDAGLDNGKDGPFVNCVDCLASTNILMPQNQTVDEAIAAWNWRATRTPPGESGDSNLQKTQIALDSSEFKPGDRVLKVEGYPFGTGDAVVLVAYECANGWRYVVEHPEGWQHIFSGKQLALSPPTDRT